MINKTKGFSLIEMMIVVVIVSILAAIALPAYQQSLQKTRRSDAKISLLDIVALQEKYYLQHRTYTKDLTSSGLNYGSASPEGYYTLAVTTYTNSGANCNPAKDTCTAFDVTATAQGTQAKDKDCSVFTLDSFGSKTSKTSVSQDSSDRCW